MSKPDELELIKKRWENFIYLGLTYEDARRDIHYLINRLEAAEKAARGFAKMTKKYKVRER